MAPVQDHSSSIEKFYCGPFSVPRIWTGLWQLSSNAWGTASVSKIRKGMVRYADLGYTAFDMVRVITQHPVYILTITFFNCVVFNTKADHYGSSEIIFGQFQASLGSPDTVVGATKWCVFKTIQPSREVVEAAVQERLERMNRPRVDLLQFYWQDYSDKGYMTALQILCDLQQKGLITAIGLCNFDTKRTDEICTQLGSGFVVTNQVQFSLIDTRPLHGMADVCLRHDIKLLTYGTLCGGFLADKWLNQPEPDLYSSMLTPSQRKAEFAGKYLDMIKAWGDWTLFQSLLIVLRMIGDRHGGVSIANVATRWVLDHPFVGAVIIGARLGLSEHPEDNHKVFGFTLTEEDNSALEAVLQRSHGHELITSIGDCGAEYR